MKFYGLSTQQTTFYVWNNAYTGFSEDIFVITRIVLNCVSLETLN